MAASVPPSPLATAVLPQTYDRVSDAEARADLEGPVASLRNVTQNRGGNRVGGATVWFVNR